MEIASENFDRLKKMVNDLSKFISLLNPKEDFKIGYPTPIIYKITQGFGVNREFYEKWGYAGHFGLDFAAPNGTPIIACDFGIVSRCGFTNDNGYYIELQHSWGKSLYLHLKNEPTFSVGQDVLMAQEIGQVGNTGIVIPKPTAWRPLAGTHLHFSIKVNGIKNPEYKDWIDPTPYLAV